MSSMSDKAKNLSSMIPSEMRLTQKWDFAVENFITRASLGLAFGGIASVVLFRPGNKRVAFATFCMGIGVGDAYRLASMEFEKEKGSESK
mmetsp:Transcript_20729/g.42136  ORF Transcript_20729/g.42136 Transcript_20729/m.42136 type:complete len:90 (+) Transcript_20729:35-304(+)